MPSNPGASKKATKPESFPQSLSDGGGPSEPSKFDKADQDVPHKGRPESEQLSGDPASATKSYASIVTGDPTLQMVELETTDDRNMPPAESSVLVGGGTLDGKHMSKSPLSKHQNMIPFFSGNPSVEITKGILHLFKEK